MKKITTIYHIISVFLVLLFLSGGPAWALTVENIRLGMHPDKTRMVLDLSEKTEFRVFLLSNPWRMVIDMPAFAWDVGSIRKPASSSIKGVRQGKLQPGISRIAIDLDRPVTIRSVFFLPRHNGKPDRLVIDFKSSSSAAFEEQKGHIFGKLKVGGALASPVARVVDSSPQKAAPAARVRAAPMPAHTPALTSAPPLASLGGMAVPSHKPPALRTGKPLIIIDAGHGGVDPGAIGAAGIKEKKIVLSMAKALKKQLEATGRYKVKLTRKKDKYLRLPQRVAYARAQGGDLFISLHADSIKKSGVRGASVYTLSEKSSDEQTARLAARENRADLIAGVDLSAENEIVANILVDLAMRDTMNQSTFFANTLVTRMSRSGIRILENPHRYAGFAVLKAPDIPSVLVEMGFMSNKNEARLLASANYQRKLAKAFVSGIDAYFRKVSQNQRT